MTHDTTEAAALDEADTSTSAEQAAVEQQLTTTGEAATRESLSAAGNRAGLQTLDRILARRLAAELLQQGLPQPTVRERLIAERGLSRRTAYRVIEAAAAHLGLRTTSTTDPQPENLPMSTTEAAPGTTAEATATAATAATVAQPQHDAAAADTTPLPVVTPHGFDATPAPGLVLKVEPPRAEPLRVRIGYMQAPWPAGAKVGHVVEFPSGQVPAWALGKCATVPSGTPADFVHQPPQAAAPVTAAAPAWDRLTLTGSTPEGRAAELKRLRADLADAEATVADLTPKLAAARERQHRASSRLVSPVSAGAPMGVVTDSLAAQREHDEASREENRLEAALRAASRRVELMRTEAEQLALQVSAPDRLSPALEARNAAAQQVRDADADVGRVADAIKRLDVEMSSEESTQAETRRTAAAQLLERARSGQSLDDVATPNEGRLNALREARAGAVDAHREAERVATAARAELARAERLVFAVLADQQLAEFQAAYARMVDAAGGWVAHHIRATKQAPGLPNFVGDVQRAIDRAIDRLDALEA